MAASAYNALALALLGEKAKLVNLYDVRILPPDPSISTSRSDTSAS